jgi:hypothetical protein
MLIIKKAGENSRRTSYRSRIGSDAGVYLLQERLDLHTVGAASGLDTLSSGISTAKAVHSDALKQRTGHRSIDHDIINDRIFGNFIHWFIPPSEIFLVLLYPHRRGISTIISKTAENRGSISASPALYANRITYRRNAS